LGRRVLNRISRALFVVGLILFSVDRARAVVIPTVPVGDAGNVADSTGYGAVAYDYRIGTTEVTNAQYVEFLNAKAASTNGLGLFSPFMELEPRGGIIQIGVPGSYAYSTKPNMADKPVNYVSWHDAIRFANWLNNGQGDGDTETGAYTILGGHWFTNYQSITRNAGATWVLANEDEWYKAAYFQPADQGGDADNYWLYPTASNELPSIATANAVGDISNPGANVANFTLGGDWNGQNGNVKTVGSAGPLSNSFYGTADQGGNVIEWNETLVSTTARGMRGASFDLIDIQTISAMNRSGRYGTYERDYIGFRVAMVPEPSTYALAAIGAVTLLAVRRRKRPLSLN
jgi:formylglycine-generating enzyme required for sulfatase activity